MHNKTFKNNPSEFLIHKVCPYCGETNKKSATNCESCGKSLLFCFGDDVCLNCGYTGKMKKKYEMKYGGLTGLLLLGSIVPTHRGKVIAKICKKCKRELRESDYELQWPNLFVPRNGKRDRLSVLHKMKYGNATPCFILDFSKPICSSCQTTNLIQLNPSFSIYIHPRWNDIQGRIPR